MLKQLILGVAVAALATAASAQVSANADAKVTLQSPLAISKTSDLDFGSVIRPSGGIGTVTIAASDGARTATSGTIAGGTPSRAVFSLNGIGGSSYAVTVPSSVTLTRVGGTETLSATLTSTGATGTISGSSSSMGTATINVGGALSVPSSGAPDGAYVGVITVTGNYN